MSQFLQDDNDSKDAKAIAIPRLFSENSRANKRKERLTCAYSAIRDCAIIFTKSVDSKRLCIYEKEKSFI